jgi:hypothetical protein
MFRGVGLFYGTGLGLRVNLLVNKVATVVGGTRMRALYGGTKLGSTPPHNYGSGGVESKVGTCTQTHLLTLFKVFVRVNLFTSSSVLRVNPT